MKVAQISAHKERYNMKHNESGKLYYIEETQFTGENGNHRKVSKVNKFTINVKLIN